MSLASSRPPSLACDAHLLSASLNGLPFVCVPLEALCYVQLSPCEDPNQLELDKTTMTSFNFNYPFKCFIFKYSHILKYYGSRLQHINSGWDRGHSARTTVYYCGVACECLVVQLDWIFLRLHRLWPTRVLCPWDFPSKNTRVGCHFLL